MWRQRNVLGQSSSELFETLTLFYDGFYLVTAPAYRTHHLIDPLKGRIVTIKQLIGLFQQSAAFLEKSIEAGAQFFAVLVLVFFFLQQRHNALNGKFNQSIPGGLKALRYLLQVFKGFSGDNIGFRHAVLVGGLALLKFTRQGLQDTGIINQMIKNGLL